MRLKGYFLNLWGKAKAMGLALLGISATVDDSPGWTQLAGGGPADRGWADLQADLLDALEAWRKNFFIRQIVRLTTAYVVSDGLKVISKNDEVTKFAHLFYTHDKNVGELDQEEMCNELTRSGELFALFFTNPADGMSYVRFVPAATVIEIETLAGDYRSETGYWVSCAVGDEVAAPDGEVRTGQRYYYGLANKRRGPKDPTMLHFAINRPIGATRGEGDLTPLLPWAKRYGEFLKDRVEYNRLRTEMAAIDLEVPASRVETKRKEFESGYGPRRGSVYIHGPDEKLSMPAANVAGWDAAPDGRALRLAIATGANVGLHFFAEGDSANRATAVEMGGPTHRHYKSRQKRFGRVLAVLVEVAWLLKVERGLADPVTEYEWDVQYPDIAVSDNGELATAARTIVAALAEMKENGWITDELAIKWAFKFAGEILDEGELEQILQRSGGEREQGSEGAGGRKGAGVLGREGLAWVVNDVR